MSSTMWKPEARHDQELPASSLHTSHQIDVCCTVGCRHGNMGQTLAKVLFDKLSSYAYIVLPILDNG